MKAMTLLTCVLAFALGCMAREQPGDPLGSAGTPVTIHVPGDFPTIREGMLAASDGDTVLVAPGEYNEQINFSGKEIVLASHYVLNQEFDLIQSTIIDGIDQQYEDTASCVLFVSGEGNGAELVGFTLRGGTGTHWVDPQYPDWTWHSGGGIFIFQASPTIRNNIIADNHVDDPLGADGASGGGICTYGGNPVIMNNIIQNNTALYGAGVVIDYSGCLFTNNIVEGNSGGQSYGGAAFWTIGNGEWPILIENNTVVNNEALPPGKAGAMYLWSSDVVARNNIFRGNTQPEGGPMFLTGGATLDLTYSNIEGGYDGEGNIDADPIFADTSFLLSSDSPCIDAGNPDVLYHDREDPGFPGSALWPSFGGLTNDMGVYGGSNCCYLGKTTVGEEVHASRPEPGDRIVNCYPNPVGDCLHVSMTLSTGQVVEVSITDSNGRLISVLERMFLRAGEHLLTFDPGGGSGGALAPGIYFCCIEGAGGSHCRTIVYLGP